MQLQNQYIYMQQIPKFSPPSKFQTPLIPKFNPRTLNNFQSPQIHNFPTHQIPNFQPLQIPNFPTHQPCQLKPIPFGTKIIGCDVGIRTLTFTIITSTNISFITTDILNGNGNANKIAKIDIIKKGVEKLKQFSNQLFTGTKKIIIERQHKNNKKAIVLSHVIASIFEFQGIPTSLIRAENKFKGIHSGPLPKDRKPLKDLALKYATEILSQYGLQQIVNEILNHQNKHDIGDAFLIAWTGL